MTATDAIAAAEEAVEAEIRSVMDDLSALCERAKEVRGHARKLTDYKDKAAKLENQLRTMLATLEDKPQTPEETNGESVDEDLAKRVKAAKESP